MTEYACIAADYPWPEVGGGRRGAQMHYQVQPVAEARRLIMSSPLWLPARDAHLWLWATVTHLGDAIFLIRALGFRYVTNAVWVKPSMGLGRYMRLRHEHLLLGVRGRIPIGFDRKVDSVIEAPRTRRAGRASVHSTKPDEAYSRIERVSPGPRAELFARDPREGWDVWGNDPAVAGVAP
jgi:N6-adenosine-specific RNA methylase IME4